MPKISTKCSNELASPSTSPIQEGILPGSQTRNIADKITISSSSIAPNTQPDPPPSATGHSAPNPLQEKPKEPEFVATIEGLYHEKLRV